MTTITEKIKNALKKEVVENTEITEDLTKTVKENFMTKIINDAPNPPEEGDLVDGEILGFEKARVYIDLSPFGTGIIYGREYLNAREVIKNASVGDTITAKVVDKENNDGYIELSLKEARQALIWSEAEELISSKAKLEIRLLSK